ncbi:LD-carboxypeptidase [Streptomyces sp. NBC_01762]|uniref:S66 peptidase family protein n=1 Tax=unclassified Streptomyces TaxID=2593676 RepID=UPI002DDA6484|nr:MULTISPECIES: S66 peptidase family protein [unclassified Streptomyces]WSC45850.1 LD-carboxypeptidase [Streptomyces sp. NBC_01762]WSD25513.1 LD-carboxypeptidase [Streptomyces sp. NBC_01751]
MTSAEPRRSPLPLSVLPPALAPGDVVAVVSPASDAAGRFPQRLERGLQALSGVGLRPRLAKNALATGRWTAGTVGERIADLHEAFEDDEVRAVMCAIGGSLSAQLLPELDYGLIAAHPKIFVGYSDMTSLHTAIRAETGLVTFYGPSVMAEWAEYPSPLRETAEHFLRVTGDPQPAGPVPRPERIVREGADWSAPGRVRRADPVPPTEVLRPGRVVGTLTGGCLPVLRRLVGTPWQPDFTDCIVLLETPQLPYSMVNAAEELLSMNLAGMFDGALGIVFGWPFRDDQIEELGRAIGETLQGHDFPVVIGFPCGHTSPMVTLPLGVRAVLDGGILSLDAAAVAPRPSGGAGW